ncbi:MAG: hypothetical protein RSG77_18330 [Hafnia sp.]
MTYMDWITFLAASIVVCMVANPNVAWYFTIPVAALFSLLLGLWFVGLALMLRFFATPSRRPSLMQCLKCPVITFLYLLLPMAMLDEK